MAVLVSKAKAAKDASLELPAQPAVVRSQHPSNSRLYLAKILARLWRHGLFAKLKALKELLFIFTPNHNLATTGAGNLDRIDVVAGTIHFNGMPSIILLDIYWKWAYQFFLSRAVGGPHVSVASSFV